MCELCSSDKAELDKHRGFLRDRAERLERLAGDYRSLAAGYIKPHTDEMKRLSSNALSIVRFLVEEWV